MPPAPILILGSPGEYHAQFMLVDDPQMLAHYPELLDHVTHKTEDSFSVISSG